MVNSDVLDGVSLVAGSYPQRYGDRTGAHVDFRTREGSRDRTQTRLSVSAINASLVAEGPLGRERRASWLLTIRKSYLDWLIRRIDPEVTGTFGFVDGQGKVVVDLVTAPCVHRQLRRRPVALRRAAGRPGGELARDRASPVGPRERRPAIDLRLVDGAHPARLRGGQPLLERERRDDAARNRHGAGRVVSGRHEPADAMGYAARGRCAPAVAARGRRRVVLRAGRRCAGAAAFLVAPAAPVRAATCWHGCTPSRRCASRQASGSIDGRARERRKPRPGSRPSCCCRAACSSPPAPASTGNHRTCGSWTARAERRSAASGPGTRTSESASRSDRGAGSPRPSIVTRVTASASREASPGS